MYVLHMERLKTILFKGSGTQNNEHLKSPDTQILKMLSESFSAMLSCDTLLRLLKSVALESSNSVQECSVSLCFLA